LQPSLDSLSVSFEDRSDPDYDRNELVREIHEKASQKHWKAATRKLKRLTRRYPDYNVPRSLYVEVLEACASNRMQGARASEPARKILEQMLEQGHAVPEALGNYCIRNSLGDGPGASHQGFGGVDTALAMLAVLDQSGTAVQAETHEKIIESLAREGSIDEALASLRRMVVDRSETPLLSTFAAVASAIVAKSEAAGNKNDEMVFTVLAYAKAAGYELEKMASNSEGRSVLASGVIAAERLGNEALGLRLLTAASQAGNVAPDRGDNLVASSSAAAQRACTLIHKRAITKAVEDSQWKLAVKVLELMLERSLRPSPWVWRNVVTCCAKAEKSKKATALLLDWIRLYEARQADKPPLSVFNTVMNACEICDEQELTLTVLDEMKKTHDTDGNLITFNIALKRLARQGNYRACEGIIIGMLQAGVEPSVVSYTTAIAACVSGPEKQPALAYEWLKRMRSRRVRPNVLTYNTALSACLDGALESTELAATIATEMLADVSRQLRKESMDPQNTTANEYTDVVPDAPTKMIARALMKQLKSNWEGGLIDKRVATETLRVPLLQLVDFQKSEAAARARELQEDLRTRTRFDEDQALATSRGEIELEYSAAASAHRVAEV
jgi:pentatricopeptide repeat protein